MAFIIAENVSVEFPIYNVSSRSIKSKFLNFTTGGRIYKKQTSVVNIKALDNLTFTIDKGDRVGLYGHNGAGKSTLLRMIAKIYEPVNGELKVEGRIMSLLDIFLGLDMDANAWINIYLRGLLLGCKPKEIKDKINEIAEFSELGNYLNMPIRTYSSGMLMRLAFSIATSMHADILLMDEWLSVGDKEFTLKAEKRMNEIVDKASILIIASHSLDLLKNTCTKIMHMEHGKITNIEKV